MPCPSVQASRPRSASLAAFWRSCCGVRLSFSEDDCTEYQESAALVDCSAVYRAVLLTLSRVAASRTLSPLAMCSRARCNLSAVTTGFRPPFLPRAAAAVNPALVRSRIKSRSNWPSAPNTWKMSRPPGVVVSMASVRERKPTPRASSAPIVSIRCGIERPSRSSRQTASTSPSRRGTVANSRW
uniref:Uncharacterized protein n=2 Tax=Escherichia coli TaxID=562 RepID=A0A2H5C7C5_ECOLX|nr:hypothetical protein PCOV5_00028 [Escherichia coli]AUH16367.1 hypothetical protein PCOV7_00120 [Escherichia coli]AUH16919.1 hypothetical protein PCOV13_00032 [Escherichia coli]AUH17347.1 hypothetical protein PCOV16_00072 [Escherichia coli]AUH17424.1 hypothetical protein PCOV17_00027 [Escherichia coli]